MASLDLPTLAASQIPPFTDARACKDWLKLVPLINIKQAHGEILDTLQQLNHSELPAIERLKMLEMLREPVALLQEQNAKRYLGKALPLSEAEAAILQANITLWLAMSMGYRHAWHAATQGDPLVLEHKALLAQRALRYQSLLLREYLQAWHRPPQAHWQDLQRLRLLASEQGVADKLVKDSQNQQTELSSCNATFAQALLLQAAKPLGLSLRQLLWVDGQLDRWSNQIHVLSQPAVQSHRALHWRQGTPDRLHLDEGEACDLWLDIDGLAKSIKKRIHLLRHGESPAQLGLGEEFASANAEQLLIQLYQHWFKQAAERSLRKNTPQAELLLYSSITGAHFALSGKPFTQPKTNHEVRGRGIADYQLFGGEAHHLVSLKPGKDVDQIRSGETWQLLNESVQGCCLYHASPKQRLQQPQLVCLQKGQSWQLGRVSWQEHADGLYLGIKLLPGRPTPLAARTTSLNQAQTLFSPALLLRPLSTSSIPMLILPVGSFKSGRIFELQHEDQLKRVKLVQLIERGEDYEQVSFAGEV